MNRLYIMLLGLLLHFSTFSQSFWFGAKTGIALNWQSWGNGLSNGLDRNQLLSIPLDLFIESYDEESAGSFYAQLGYKKRGSAYRFFNSFNATNTNQRYEFNNLSLELGISKPINKTIAGMVPFYKFALRGEYTLSTNLEEFLVFNSPYFPSDDFVKKFPWGVTAGGGFTLELADMYGLIFDFSICPDIGFQYEQPPIANVREPFTNQIISLDLRQVRNLSFEAKVGLRFLRKVEYID
jgi:hypothetical protein